MKPAARSRVLTAWMLYFCILFSALACSVGHGQMAGLQLSGIGGLYCSAEGNSGPGLDQGFAGQAGSGLGSLLGGLVCVGLGLGLGLALLFCLSWMRRPARCPAPTPEQRCKAPPRYTWPSANPRASPFLA